MRELEVDKTDMQKEAPRGARHHLRRLLQWCAGGRVHLSWQDLDSSFDSKEDHELYKKPVAHSLKRRRLVNMIEFVNGRSHDGRQSARMGALSRTD